MSISIVSAVSGTAPVQGATPYGDPPDKAAAAAQAQAPSPVAANPPLDEHVPPAILSMLIHQQLSNGSSLVS